MSIWKKNVSFASLVHAVFGKFVVKRRRFRELLSSQAEWCTMFGSKRGKKMGGGCKISGYGTFFPAAHLFPPSLADSAHHSAANVVSVRNPLRKITKIRQQPQRERACETWIKIVLFWFLGCKKRVVQNIFVLLLRISIWHFKLNIVIL